MHIGVLTGGGDCPGLNAVIRAVTKALINECGAQVTGIERGFLGLLERRVRPLGLREASGIAHLGGTILGTHNRADPFRYFGAGGADCSQQVMDYVRELGLDAVVVIGGDGSMSIAHRFSQLGLPVVGVPKTIDNDLMHNERSFGFDSAVAVVTESIERLETTAQSHGRVMIVETMGRYSGWIALEAGMAGAADVILLPELPYDIDAVARRCSERAALQGYTIVCVAEGACARGQAMTVQTRLADSPDPLRLGGIGNVLREQLQQRLDGEVRAVQLGHVQRGGSPTAFDRVLATRFGYQAAQLVAQGRYGHMVALEGNRCIEVSLAEVAGRNRTVPADHELLQAARGLGICLG